MTDKLNIIKLIEESEKGPIELKQKMFVKLPERMRDESFSENYLCSQIISIVKYDNRRINVSFVDLSKNYKGKEIDIINDDEIPWHYTTTNPIVLASLKASTSWKDFK